jgi:hypothetical protein
LRSNFFHSIFRIATGLDLSLIKRIEELERANKEQGDIILQQKEEIANQAKELERVKKEQGDIILQQREEITSQTKELERAKKEQEKIILQQKEKIASQAKELEKVKKEEGDIISQQKEEIANQAKELEKVKKEQGDIILQQREEIASQAKELERANKEQGDIILQQKEEIASQAKQILKMDSDLCDLKKKYANLYERYKNALDDRFQRDDKFFQADIGLARGAVGDEIRHRLDEAVDLDELDSAVPNQIRSLVDRISQCHALEAPYKDVWQTTVENIFKDRLQDPTFDLDDLLGLIGQNPLSKACFDMVVGLQRKHIEKLAEPQAFPLKTSDVDNILLNKDVAELKVQAEKFSTILVPAQINTRESNHWLMFCININEKSISCINTTRNSILVHDRTEGKQFFGLMEKIALTLFPEKFENKINLRGKSFFNTDLNIIFLKVVQACMIIPLYHFISIHYISYKF